MGLLSGAFGPLCRSSYARAAVSFVDRVAPKLAGAAASFIFWVVVARASSVVTYGEAAILLTISGLAAPFSSLGQRFVVLRDVPRVIGNGIAEAAAIIRTANRIAALGAALTGTLLALAIWLTNEGVIAHLAAIALLLSGFLIFFQGALEYVSQVLRALGKGSLSIYIREVAPRFLAVMLLALAVNFSGIGADLLTVVGTLAVGTAISLGIAVVVARRDLNSSGFRKGATVPQFREGLRFLPRITAGTLREYMDVLILSAVGSAADVAIYFTLARFSALLNLPGTSLSTNAIVEATALQASGHHRKTLLLARQLFVQSGAIVVPIAVCLCVFAHPLLSLFHISATGHETAILLVFMNGAVVGSFLGIWELMQVLHAARYFHTAFLLIVGLGAIAMYMSAAVAGVAGLAAAYFAMNCTWIALGLFELFTSDTRSPGVTS